VVKDAKYRGLREPMTPTFYTASDSAFSVLAVRTHRSPDTLIEPVRKALAALDPALPFTEIHTLAEEVDASIAPERLTAALAAIFGAFASFLAAAGIYGLLAFAVEQRRREIGIRMALGARPGQIGSMLGRQTAILLGTGLALGLTATLLLAGSLRALLYGIAPTDPLSMAAAALLMAVVAAAATWVPAHRATRVQPSAALRE
jgi:predicted lysophospholipase L1 biosynthesis ABC-type transport system permease subunit